MSETFIVAETELFQKNIQKTQYRKLYKKIVDYVYPILRRNPYYGPNIKKLKGKLSKYYRYRIGNYRLFYEVDREKIMIFVIDIADRKNAYD
ncbi:MAG: type II toxin-antitoxin system RelE/ParE family toxin [bacterium]|nr:type II toxin-antitoxin system RelE/ParE family toxin [bacterium]